MFKKKDVDYFELFSQSAAVCHSAALKLEEMFNSPYEQFADMTKLIHDIEHEGDAFYHNLYNELNRSFITPIEREDILEIARNIEHTTDTIDEVAITLDLLSVKEIKPVAIDLVKLIIKSTEQVALAAKELKNFKKPEKLNKYLVEINNIEEQGDAIYQAAVKELFSSDNDALDVIKWKSVLDSLEAVLDACENVADGMEGVIVKNS